MGPAERKTKGSGVMFACLTNGSSAVIVASARALIFQQRIWLSIYGRRVCEARRLTSHLVDSVTLEKNGTQCAPPRAIKKGITVIISFTGMESILVRDFCSTLHSKGPGMVPPTQLAFRAKIQPGWPP